MLIYFYWAITTTPSRALPASLGIRSVLCLAGKGLEISPSLSSPLADSSPELIALPPRGSASMRSGLQPPCGPVPKCPPGAAPPPLWGVLQPGEGGSLGRSVGAQLLLG